MDDKPEQPLDYRNPRDDRREIARVPTTLGVIAGIGMSVLYWFTAISSSVRTSFVTLLGIIVVAKVVVGTSLTIAPRWRDFGVGLAVSSVAVFLLALSILYMI